MSIQSEIDRLNAAKADIQSALVEGGQTVESTDTLTDYAGKIRALSSGFAEQIAYHNEDSEAHSDIRAAIPTETSQLTNDSGYIDTTEAIDLISSHGSSVNGYANLTVEAGDNIGLTFKNGEPDAYGSSTEGTMTISATVPTKTSDLTNDSGFITGYTETDPTVPAWAKAASKPTYTAGEVGAVPMSGGTLNDGAKLSLSLYGTRFLHLTGNDILLDMSGDSGIWAATFAAVKDATGTTTEAIGFYGSTEGLGYMWFGGPYSDPFMKMTPSGQVSFKSKPDVGGISLATVDDVPAWAKSASKPTYTYSEVGAAASSHTHTPASIGAAPAYTYGTADLTAGVSALATGQLHFVYEVGDDNSDAS